MDGFLPNSSTQRRLDLPPVRDQSADLLWLEAPLRSGQSGHAGGPFPPAAAAHLVPAVGRAGAPAPAAVSARGEGPTGRVPATGGKVGFHLPGGAHPDPTASARPAGGTAPPNSMATSNGPTGPTPRSSMRSPPAGSRSPSSTENCCPGSGPTTPSPPTRLSATKLPRSSYTHGAPNPTTESVNDLLDEYMSLS